MALDISLILRGLQRYRESLRDLRADFEVSEERRLAGEAREATLREEKKKLTAEAKKSVEEHDALTAKVRSLEDQVKEVGEKRAADREWASSLETRVSESDHRVGELEKEVAALRGDVELAGFHAVRAYKESSDFSVEVAEGCLDAFHLGFVQCRRIAAEIFPGLDVSKIIEPEDLEGLPETEETVVEVPTSEVHVTEEVVATGIPTEPNPEIAQEGGSQPPPTETSGLVPTEPLEPTIAEEVGASG